jgi:hypothetical protein
MLTLTLEALRENPWNVVTYKLPSHPKPLLVNAAYLAAEYCHKSEYLFMVAARDGSYIPHGWETWLDKGHAWDESEARACHARQRLEEILDLGQKEFGWLIAS